MELFWNGTWHSFKRGIRIYAKERLRLRNYGKNMIFGILPYI